ncbi:MAG: hypothetical protein ACPGTP_09870, partial [Bacteroidia bacterium]
MKQVITFLMLISSFTMLGQIVAKEEQAGSKKAKLYIDLTYNKHFNSELPRIYNYPHKVGQWRTIDVTKLDDESKERPLKYVSPLSMKSGVSVLTDKGNSFNLGLSYNHYNRKDTLGYTLAYSDMLSPTQGYVMTSSYLLLSGFHLYRTVSLEADYLIEDAINGY